MSSPVQIALVAGAVLGGTGVALGALGAHALKKVLVPERLAAFDTATKYQLFHALLLLVVGLWLRAELPVNAPWLVRSVWLILVGCVCFSGSIYGLCFTEFRWLGPVTPLGGTLLIGGWVCLMIHAWHSR
jgi:uncharacterized membrane protein YgdD (TMEM256/DUF423 family)